MNCLTILWEYISVVVMVGPSKLITAENKPRSFAVIEAAYCKPALQDMRDAFANKNTHLVVWNNAGDLVSNEVKEAVEKLRRQKIHIDSVRRMDGPGNFWENLLHKNEDVDGRLSCQFNGIANHAHLKHKLLMAWQKDSAALLKIIHDELNPTELLSQIRAHRIEKTPGLHYDGAKNSGSIVALRVLSGDPTEYYDPEDYAGMTTTYNRGRQKTETHHVRKDATRWMTRPLAIAFHSNQILHSAASTDNTPLATRQQHRVIEFFLMQGCGDIVAAYKPKN